jgi:hypothetical protein
MSIWTLLVRRLGEAKKKAKREGNMERRNKDFRTAKRAAVALIAGFAAVLFYKLDGELVQVCGLLHIAGWAVLQVVQPLIVGGWAAVQAHVTDNSGCLQHLPQIVATLGSLLCGVAG